MGGTAKKVRTLDAWVASSSKERTATAAGDSHGGNTDAADESMIEATGEEKSKDGAKPKPQLKPKPEAKAKPAAEPNPNPEGETAKGPEPEPSSGGSTELCADVCGKGVCLEAVAGCLWMSVKPPSADGAGKKVSPFCVLWHTREGKLKSAPVLKEGMFPYKLTMMDQVCFSKKGEISVPKRLGDCLNDLGIKGLLHHGEWTSEKPPNILSPPSQQWAFAPLEASVATLLENVKQMSQATL